MKKSILTMLISLSALSLGTSAQAAPAPGDNFAYANEQFADIQMLRYKVEGFDRLSLRQKTLIYHLSEAALAGRDILYDQNGRYNLRLRDMLETVYRDYRGDRKSKDFQAFVTYLKRFWFSSGLTTITATRSLYPDSPSSGCAPRSVRSTTRSTKPSIPSSSIPML